MENPEITAEKLDGNIWDLVSKAKLGTWMSESWLSWGYKVSKMAMSVYTRILQRGFDSTREDVNVNSLHPGTAHFKIQKIRVIRLEEFAEAVTEWRVTPEARVAGKKNIFGNFCRILGKFMVFGTTHKP